MEFTDKQIALIDALMAKYIKAGVDKDDRLLRRYKCHPKFFVSEVIGVKKQNNFVITKQQHELLSSAGRLAFCKQLRWDFERSGRIDQLPRVVLNYSKQLGITVRAGRGTGKSSSSSWLIFWFMCLFQDAKIPAVGPTEKSLKTILWAELYLWYNKLQKNGDIQFQEPFRSKINMMASEVRIDNNPNWTTFQRVSPRNSDEGTLKAVLGGLHADNMLILIDEASSIQDQVFQPLESTLTSRCNFVIALFNPTKNSGWAHDSHFDAVASQDFIKLHWNGEHSELVSPTYLKSLAKRYGGRDNNNYRVSVLGVPPTTDDNSLIPFTWCEDASSRVPFLQDNIDVVLGCDIARSGADSTIVSIRQGKNVLGFEKINEIETFQTSVAILKIAKKYQAKYICIDSLGIGSGVFDTVRASFPKTYGVENSRRSNDPEKYFNLRAECFYRLRLAFEMGSISLPSDDSELKMQLSTIRFSDEGGKIKIESKKEIKKRLGGESPDIADSLAISFYIDDLQDVAVKASEIFDPYAAAFAKLAERQNELSWMAM